MSTTRIHKDKQPRRPHFLKEWMATREGLIAADLAREIGADKSLVSRWPASGSTLGGLFFSTAKSTRLQVAELFSLKSP